MNNVQKDKKCRAEIERKLCLGYKFNKNNGKVLVIKRVQNSSETQYYLQMFYVLTKLCRRTSCWLKIFFYPTEK